MRPAPPKALVLRVRYRLDRRAITLILADAADAGRAVPIRTGAAIRELRHLVGRGARLPDPFAPIDGEYRWLYDHVARLFPGLDDEPGDDLVDTVLEAQDET